MTRKLPMFGDLARKKPTVDAARQKLGGRVVKTSAPLLWRPGRVVDAPGLTGGRESGVVLFTDAGRTDVLFERGVVRRIASSELVAPAHQAHSTAIERLAFAVRRFDNLSEGDAIIVTEHDGRNQRAVLREKCRFGALVERADGAIFAAGFDRVAPLPEAGS